VAAEKGGHKNASQRKLERVVLSVTSNAFPFGRAFFISGVLFFKPRKEAIMSDDIKLKDEVLIADKEPVFAIKFVFKPAEPNKVLRTEESQLLLAHIGEILEEIEIEEKLILEEERKAALEVTARNSNKEEQ
jgi:hypothetical protein